MQGPVLAGEDLAIEYLIHTDCGIIRTWTGIWIFSQSFLSHLCSHIPLVGGTLWSSSLPPSLPSSLAPSLPLFFSFPASLVIFSIFISRHLLARGFPFLHTLARTWKQPKCPSTDEWIKKTWHIYTMEYYSTIKRNEIELFVVRWMDLESVLQSEVSQVEKNKYHMLTHIYGI